MLSNKIFTVKKVFTIKKKFFFDYNLHILKEIIIMAGISNHNIVDFIEKKTSDDVKKNLSAFFLQIMLQDL